MRPVTCTAVTGSCNRSSLLLLAALAACSGKKKDEEPPAPKPAPTLPEPTGPVKPRAPLATDDSEHSGKLVWARAFGGEGRDEAKAVDIDADGNVAVAGIFTGEVDFGAGKFTSKDTSGFVGVLGPDGKPKWMAPLSAHLPKKDAGDVTVADVTVSGVTFDGKGNLAVVGWFSNVLEVGDLGVKAKGADDAFVAVFDKTGKPQWVKALGGDNTDIAWGVAAAPDGGLAVIGERRGAADFGGGEFEAKGSADIWLVRLNADGDHLWSRSWGDMGEDNGRAVVFDSRGDVIIAVEMDLPLDFGDGKPLPHKGKGDVAIVKLSTVGNLRWARSFGNTFDDVVLGLAVDGADEVIFSGSFEDKLKIGNDKLTAGERADAYVAKLDPEGNPLWARSWGGQWEDMAAGVGADKFGNIVVTGWFQGTVDFGGGPQEAPNGNMDGFLMKLAPDGKHLWSRRFGDKDHDRGRAVAVAPAGDIALGGIFRFTLDLGGETLRSSTKTGDKIAPADAFFARFGP
ncbi:MAG TPA: hypothetical protein VL172_09810 [Kofleriaceae bacterium]|nr:hypothetical protein [Kofleriaceae bacterium]